jgi:hypothetical protein
MKKNTPKDYVSIRVSVVHVKKMWGLYVDNELSKQVCIPDSWEDANKLVGEIQELMKKYGKPLSIEGK